VYQKLENKLERMEDLLSILSKLKAAWRRSAWTLTN
jgi:hypothetical protein